MIKRAVFVGAFGRVDVGAGPPLSAEQVEELDDGEVITIIWSGGNGPWRCKVIVDQGERFAQSFHTSREMALASNNPLTFVGSEPWHTRVWRGDWA